MRRKKIDVIRVTVLSALLCGLAGCAESGGTSPASSDNKDPVEVAAAELGVAIPGCAASGSGYVYASTGGTLTLTVDTDPLVLSTTTGSKLTANGFTCVGTVSTVANTQIKTTDVAKIVIYGSANDNKVILDFLPGTFGTKILAANGGILVNFADNSASAVAAGAGADSLMIRAGTAAETYKFAKSTTTSDVYVEINGDKVADINVKPSAAGTLALAASMGGGADNVFANTAASAIDKFSAVTGLVVGPMALGVTAYGGIGDDHFTGGAGPDAFFGGDNNDTFNMDALADGADVYSGDLGIDTVDYSNRTAAVNVDLGPLSPSLFGTVDLATPGLYGASGTLDTKTLAVAINNQRVETVFSAPASPEAVLTAINTAANTALTTTSLVYATMSAQNKLVVTNPSGTATSPVQVQGTLAIATAAGAAADGILGLTAGGATVTTPVVGTVDLSTLTWGGSATLNAKRLLLVLNGLYFTVTFTTPANIAAALTAINTAADTALGTTGGTYATEDATHHLTLTAGSVAIKDGALAKALTSAHTQLGLTAAVATAAVADADDGLVDADLVTVGNQPEGDDVRYSTENILSGSGDDVLIGNALKNSIKGGLGNDTISGGSNASCGATDGDTLFGEDGNDTFLSPMINCKAAYTGGAGDNVVDFSGRTQILTLKNDAAALDGEGTEAANIGADVLKMIGGFGADAITGGVGDDILVGGPGADVLVGGAGNDTVDYSGSPSAVSVTLCFAAAIGTCGTADDGTTAGSGEGDQVYQIEHAIGSNYIDTLSGSTAPSTIDVTIEGGLLGDTITGGAGNDTLWGDAGDDTIHGGPGDDNISGGAGIDVLDGGDGDGDICLSDSSDVAATRIACEL
jgi:Ca2+-binding RTX toxin-like protein